MIVVSLMIHLCINCDTQNSLISVAKPLPLQISINLCEDCSPKGAHFV